MADTKISGLTAQSAAIAVDDEFVLVDKSETSMAATTFVMDGSVGTSGSDLNLNTTSIVSGANVSISSATFTAGNA